MATETTAEKPKTEQKSGIIGAIAGAGVGLVATGMNPLGAIAGGLIGYFGGKAVSQSAKGMTPERRLIFEQAMTKTDITSDQLRTLADGFEQDGLTREAELLRKRAKLREAPPAIKATRRKVYDAAMASKDPAFVEKTAVAFEKEGAIGAAKSLREYAQGLRTAAKATA